MQNNTQQIVTYCCSTVNITTVSYRNCSYFSYCEIHMKSYIKFYFLLNYNNSLIFSMFYIKLSQSFFSNKYQNLFFCGIFNTTFLQQSKKAINFDFGQQQQVQTPNYHYPNPSNTERRNNIGCRPVVVRQILTQT